MAVSTKTTIKADSVLCTLTPGSGDGTAIEWDIAADSNPLMSNGAHTTNKFTSQQIKAQGIQKDGVYESVTLTVTFHETEFAQVETWWKKGSMLTYTVTGMTTTAKEYKNCVVRVSSTPTVVPGKEDYLTFQLEITSLMNVAADADATGEN